MNSTGKVYFEILQTTIQLQIIEIAANNPQEFENKGIAFQQYATPLHFYQPLRLTWMKHIMKDEVV